MAAGSRGGKRVIRYANVDDLPAQIRRCGCRSTASSRSLLKIRVAKFDTLTKQRARPARAQQGAGAAQGDNGLD
jgi:hypothetical protein